MAEYIEREELKKVLSNEAVHCLTFQKIGEARGLIKAKEIISKLPSADVDKVVSCDVEITKEIQGIKESMKRHIDLTNEMGQELLHIDAEYTGGSKIWLTTDFFEKIVKHFSHSNYLVKCLELAFNYINRLQADCESLKSRNSFLEIEFKNNSNLFDIRMAQLKAEAYKEFAERLKKALYSDSCRLVFESDLNIFECAIDNLLKEMLGGNETESALPPSRQAATPPSMKEAMKNFKPEEE